MKNRSSGGLSNPNCFSSCLMNSGSRPWAPRYLAEPGSWAFICRALCWAPMPSPPLPEMREVAPESVPVSCAITRSTGPPGANCTMAKLITMIPNIVGKISNRRLRRYAAILPLCWNFHEIDNLRQFVLNFAALSGSYHQVSTMPRSYFGFSAGRPNLSQ